MSAPPKPSVLVLGGVNTVSRALVSYLVPSDGEPKVSHLRIADKFTVNPATTYIGSEFAKLVQRDPGNEHPIIQYSQFNLTVPDRVTAAFTPPEGCEEYSYIFDYTGEVRPDRPEEVHKQQTAQIAYNCGKEAEKRGVKAYVRLQMAVYDTSEKGAHDEKEVLKPNGPRGLWWHETLRVLANMEQLKLVIIRAGFVYGPYIDQGIIASTLTVAACYGFLKKPMKALWSPGKNSMNTVHVDDVSRAMWACANWIAPLTRVEANNLAGEEILAQDRTKVMKEAGFLPEANKRPVAPLFNLVDDSESTQLSIGTTVTGFFGTTFGFHDFFTSTIASIQLSKSMIEEINDEHVSTWNRMIVMSNPPVTNTPLTTYLDKHALQKRVVALNNAKIKRVVGLELSKPKFAHEHIKEMVEKWKAEKNWPVVPEDA